MAVKRKKANKPSKLCEALAVSQNQSKQVLTSLIITL
jgi:hypothetical protein